MRFECTGNYQTFTAEADKTYVFDLLGAGGGGGAYGGGHVQALYKSPTSKTLYICVGGTSTGEHGQIGGFNGGGNGGVGYTGDGVMRYGYGGGGATDIRTSTSITNRILVSGGGGGSGSNGGGQGGKFPETVTSGYPNPPMVDEYGVWCSGGARGTLTTGGTGGVAPSITGLQDVEANDGTYYPDSGGGGGGGYYGGGGGSSGVVDGKKGTSYSGVAGGSGSLGVGGNGGGKTSGSSGWTTSPSGGGGGGSSFISSDTNILSGIYDQTSNYGDGLVLVHEVLSSPIITDVIKDGNKIYITIDKEDNKDVEEIFYYNINLDNDERKALRDPSNSVVISDAPKKITYTIPENLSSGYHTVYISVSSADGQEVKDFVTFLWDKVEPTLEFNYEVLNKVLIQGRYVENTYFATGLLSGDIPLKYETKLIIDGQEYGCTQASSDTMIYLPCLYDGLNNREYSLKLKTRVGQLAKGTYGHGRDIWSQWFESDELTIYAPIVPLNKLEFFTKLSDKAVEKDTKLKISWGITEKANLLKNSNNFEYILSFFKDNELLSEINCGKDTEKELVMSFPHGEGYKFGVSILENKELLSDIVFSETFQIANINTGGKVSLSQELQLTTSIEDAFNKIELLINDNVDKEFKENINEKIPLWKLRNGNNVLEVKIFKDENIYVKHTFKVFIHILKDNIQKVETHTIDVKVAVNGSESSMVVNPVGEPVIEKLGVLAQEYEVEIKDKVVQEINQKITIKKNEDSNHDIKILEIIGGLG